MNGEYKGECFRKEQINYDIAYIYLTRTKKVRQRKLFVFIPGKKNTETPLIIRNQFKAVKMVVLEA